jgi:hypothetical protein
MLLPCDGIATLQTLSWWAQESPPLIQGMVYLNQDYFVGYMKLPMNSVIRGTIKVMTMTNYSKNKKTG